MPNKVVILQRGRVKTVFQTFHPKTKWITVEKDKQDLQQVVANLSKNVKGNNKDKI